MMTQHNRAVPAGTGEAAGLRPLVVCADDFGLHEGVNAACVALAGLGRISAISCMVDGPAWRHGLPSLGDLPPGVEVGLHLNFTEPFSRAEVHWPLNRLIVLAYARRLPARTITREIIRQLQAFEADTGRPPDFIDGHQHVHQLPGVRDALLDVLDEHAFARRPWLRSTLYPSGTTGRAGPCRPGGKARIISSLGARALLHLADARGYAHNDRLLGVYGFDGSEADYLARLEAWLGCAQEGDLLMCHPANGGPASDSILPAREREYHVLGGDGFAAAVAAAGIAIRPLHGD